MLKEKYHEKNITDDEKMQILTLFPQRWTIAKVAKILGTSRYFVKKSKKLIEAKGIFSKPEKRKG